MRWVKAKQDATLLVCANCFKRIDAKDRLTKPLKKVVKPLGYKLVRTRCLGVCPKDAVVLNDSRRPREWLLVRPGVDPDDVAASLFETIG